MMAMPTRVLVVAGGSRPALGAGARELLALGRTLADGLGGTVDFLLLGADAAAVVAEAAAAGADRVCKVAGADRPGYHPEQFAQIVQAACRELSPCLILLPHTPFGQDLAPRLAFGLEVHWASNCVGAEILGGEVRCTRNIVGGKVQVIEALDGPVVMTLRPKSVDAPAPQSDRSAVLVEVAPPSATGDGAVVLLERHHEEGGAAAQLEQAEVIVSGGLGMGSAKAFEQVRALAAALGGTAGASKQAVDRGWVPPDWQVGITGVTVAPRLYVAVGISGALQHMAGCLKSKMIVAINKDREAPIFRHARYGMVAEWEQVLPVLLDQLRVAEAD